MNTILMACSMRCSQVPPLCRRPLLTHSHCRMQFGCQGCMVMCPFMSNTVLRPQVLLERGTEALRHEVGKAPCMSKPFSLCCMYSPSATKTLRSWTGRTVDEIAWIMEVHRRWDMGQRKMKSVWEKIQTTK